MGQADIIRVLKKDRWKRASLIEKQAGINRSAVNVAIRKLIKQGDVERRRIKNKNNYPYFVYRLT